MKQRAQPKQNKPKQKKHLKAAKKQKSRTAKKNPKPRQKQAKDPLHGERPEKQEHKLSS